MVLVSKYFKSLIVIKVIGRRFSKYIDYNIVYNKNKNKAGRLFLRSYFYGDKF